MTRKNNLIFILSFSVIGMVLGFFISMNNSSPPTIYKYKFGASSPMSTSADFSVNTAALYVYLFNNSEDIPDGYNSGVINDSNIFYFVDVVLSQNVNPSQVEDKLIHFSSKISNKFQNIYPNINFQFGKPVLISKKSERHQIKSMQQRVVIMTSLGIFFAVTSLPILRVLNNVI